MASPPQHNSLQAIRYKRGQLQLLDQRKLPLETVYLDIPDSSSGRYAIKEMVVRGAPAIAIAAALSLAVEAFKLEPKPASVDEAVQFLYHRLDDLVTSRPTAVNLSDAATKLKEKIDSVAAASSNIDSIFNAYIEAAEVMLDANVASNKAIGAYGAEQILKHQKHKEKVSILTHCNTGCLATAAYGTALGVIRSLHTQGKLDRVYCTETRPYNQGSRLTAYELVYEKIPAVLIADSAASALQRSGKVDAIVVGADRVAANGDTANKIGTYSLALSAFHHDVPFYVAAPLTSIDTNLKSGDFIVIEERCPKELTHLNGGQGSQIAATGISVWNPAFDVTPAQFITAIITDKGIITKPQGSTEFDIPLFCKLNEQSNVYLESELERKANGLSNGSKRNEASDKKEDFYILNETSLRQYIERLPSLASRLGGESKDWNVKEVGDGNLNFVYIVVGSKGSLVLKQSVPYVRCVGESWPMTSDRAYYESTTLEKHGSLCPQHVPEVYHFDRVMSAIIMEYLEPPYIILRKGLIVGVVYPLLADHMSEYMAHTLFYTSLLARSTLAHRTAIAEFCGNVEMCRLTEQVVFTDPYMISSNNRWTSPHLDDDAKALRDDDVLKREVAELKSKFCELSQALIHGDLHTGSIMVTVSSTKVIDPEFSFYGPIGFDVGAFLGNLLLAYFSQDGHADNEDDREAYKRWLLKTIVDTWNGFDRKFTSLWTANWNISGDAYHPEVYKSSSERILAQKKYMEGLLHDTLGFSAAKMIRRIVGIAHVEDFESIENPDLRAKGEKRALSAAKKIIKERRTLSSINQLLELIRSEL